MPYLNPFKEISMAESTAQLNELYQQARDIERIASNRRQAGAYAKLAGILV